MLNIEQLKERLSDRNISKVARKIGISRQYISQALSGREQASQNLVEKLNKYLEEN